LLPKTLGVALALTTSDRNLDHGPVFQFNNLGKESGRLACYLIQEMMDGLRTHVERKKLEDKRQIEEIEREMERKAIQMSLADAR
jgi:hypothetical protein